MDKLPPQAIEHFNKAAKEFSEKLVEYDFSKHTPAPPKVMSSSHKEVPTVDLGKMGVKLEVLRMSNEFGELEEIYQDTDKGWIGLNSTQINEFKKFIKSLLPKLTWVSYKTLEDIAFRWMVSANLGSQEDDILTYLEKWKEKNVGSYYVYFIIRNLVIENSFELGKIVIGFYDEEALTLLLNSLKRKLSAYQEKTIRDKYIGTVVAVCLVNDGEINAARELAYKECSLTVDALKMFTPTIDLLELRIDFDIDTRVSEMLYEQDILAIRIEDNNQDFLYATFNTNRSRAKTFKLDDDALKIMNRLGIDIVHKFLKDDKDTELCKLISQSIQYFAATLSQPDLHRRVVDIFTIMESLTLKSVDDKIISVLSTYIPKILTKDPIERKGIAKLLKTMYGIRSAVIHHGKRQDFDMNDLANLQRCLRVLILRLIQLSDKHVKKDTILQEIDDAINEAY